MTTFSQLVDRILVEVVRPDLLATAAAYLNQTIREAHSDAETNFPVLFDDNRLETRIAVTSVDVETGAFVWALPDIVRLQRIEEVFYNSIKRSVYQRSLKGLRTPNLNDPMDQYYWYRVGNSIAFSKPGVSGSFIDIAYHLFPRSLVYYKAAERKVIFDDENQIFMYDPTVTDPEAAMAKASNWLLSRHTEMLAEGVRAKIYKRLADTERARLCYSQYRSMLLAMQRTEGVNLGAERMA